VCAGCVGFVRALLRLLRNIPYVYCAGFKICANIIVVGVLLNAVRYVEIAFYQPAFVASIISGQLAAYYCDVMSSGHCEEEIIIRGMQRSPSGSVWQTIDVAWVNSCWIFFGLGNRSNGITVFSIIVNSWSDLLISPDLICDQTDLLFSWVSDKSKTFVSDLYAFCNLLQTCSKTSLENRFT